MLWLKLAFDVLSLRLSWKFHSVHQNCPLPLVTGSSTIVQHAWDKGESFKTTVVATSPTPPRIRKWGEKTPLWKTIWVREALSPISNTLRITVRLWLAHLWTQVKMQSSAAQAAQIFLPGAQQQPSGQGFTARRRKWWEAVILVKMFLKLWDPLKDSDSQAGQAFTLSDLLQKHYNKAWT